jgi:hypothetical protein
MANTANSTLTTDFNLAPYYDDYNESKQFYRILYRPGFAVQARELTQMQTAIQKQIERFGRHVFKEGTIVIPGAFQLFAANTKSSVGAIDYVKLKDTDDSNNDIAITNFSGVEVTGATTGIKALISIVADGSENSGNNKTIYVNYLQASQANSSIVKFNDNEVLVSNVGNLVTASANSTGFGSAFRISSGVVFSKGHFIWFPTQDVILDRYNDTPTCKVGFFIAESIVNSSSDSTLLDPALESSNYSAPGADRFRFDAELQVREIDDPQDIPDFTTLFTIDNGVIQAFNERTEYSIIKDEWAKRTFDESGDYYVRGLDLDVREHLLIGDNGGVFSNTQGGNSALISVKVDPGIAYVKGYEVGTISPTYLTTEKSTDYANVENQLASAFLGSYISINEMVGHLPVDTGVEIELYDTFQNRISNGTFTAAQTGAKIGTARVSSIEYNNGTLGTAAGRADLYLMNIRMLGSNNFSSVKSVYIDNSTNPDFGADVIPDPVANSTVLYEPFNTPSLYFTGSNHTRKVKDTSETSDTTYLYTTSSSVTITSGAFSVAAPGSDSLPYSGTLSATAKREILLSLNSTTNISTSITATNIGTTIVGTNFNKLNVGDKLRFSGLGDSSANIYTILSIANSTHLVINKEPALTLTGNTVFKHYGTGDYIDLTTLGFDSGTVRSVSAAGTTLSFDLNEANISGSATVVYRVAKTSAIEAKKVLRPSRYVQINCDSAGTSGPYNLGFSDIYKVRQIRKKSSTAFSSNTEGTEATLQFNIDNGQRDTHYDLGSITPISSLSSSDRLLVELDYFIPDYSQGKGHFTVDSYPVDDANTTSTTITTAQIPIYKSPTSGKSYDLRNYLDFRPIKTITAADSTTVAGASVNPSASTTFNFTGSGINFVAPSSQIIFDYSFYLGRKDVVHLNKDRIFSITKGVPASLPVTPQISDNEMALAILNITPFPSISPYYAKLLGRQEIGTKIRWVAAIRQTMRDIGVMKDRIVNLEYYASLSLLEKNALDLLITDENGNDRFKNGIFVDTFTDHQLGATYNSDYRIVVDPQEKSIRPLYSMQSINYDYLTGNNVRKTGDLVTLDYSEVEFANVVSATSILNTERSSVRFIGRLTLKPAQDVWIDTITLPPNTITINDANLDGTEDAQQIGGVTTTWNSWQTTITGYKVYAGEDSTATLIGTFSSLAEALRVAQNIRTTTSGATIETIEESSRTGAEQFTFLDSDSTSIGSRVISTEIVPYIRAQTIVGQATGLKPFAKFNVFFDGINMSEYVRPISELEYIDPDSVSRWQNTVGGNLIADANGELWFRLNLPNLDNLKFTVGQKSILLTDSPTASDLATTFASTSFFAQGLIETKQDTILSTRQIEYRQKTVSETTIGSSFTSLPPLPERDDGGDDVNDDTECLAYVVNIKAPDNEEGLFLTSVEVFVEEKHPTLGVWFEVREVDAGGGITLNQVPFSEKWYRNSEVPISTDGRTNGFKVTFDTPLFLYNNKSYALVVHPEAGNPNYYLWVSRIGEVDVNTGRQITNRAFTGSTFTTNNNVVWNLIDQVDITCKWNRASFVSSGNFEIGNKPKEKLYIENIVGSIEGFGEPIASGDRLTLAGYSGPTIEIDDIIVGNTSNINASVVNISSGTFSMSNIRYTVGESVLVRYASNLTVKGSATISTRENGKGYLDYYKETPNSTYIILDSSNGKFFANDSIFDISDEGSARISKIGNLRYSLVDFEPAIINFAKASQSFEMTSYSNTGIAQSYRSIDSGENYEFGTEMAIFSRSNEISSLSSNRSNKVRVNMNSSSSYLSPVFDIGRTQTIIVDNIINANTVGEDNPSGGQLFNKYISKIVTLAEGQDAEDLKVYLTAYRPPNSDVKVWIKILNGEDSDTISQKSWIELEKSFGGDISFSSLVNKRDFKEFKFNVPTDLLTGPEGQVRYTNSQGIVFTGYKSFQIKIGLIGTNSAIVPRVADLRCIALQI